uniref:RdRp n=1 Tax=viral metagenome TaxID=1070528 RepID=A0A2V0RJ29_9ZZZZ
MQTLPLDPLLSELGKDEAAKLSQSLNRIVKGNDTVLVTPVAERVGPDDIKRSWNKVFQANIGLMNDELIAIEEAQKLKFGPRSIAKPWSEIRATALSSFELKNIDCSHLESKPRASSDIGRLRPVSIETSAKRVRKDTQSGPPYFAKKGAVLSQTLDNLPEQYDRNWEMAPAIRTQEQGKTRLVKIFPFSDILIENSYFLPLFEYTRRQPGFSAMIGPDAVDVSMTRLISEAVRLNQYCLSGDIDTFDDSCNASLQHNAFTELSQLLQPAYRQGFSEVERRFLTKPLITPEGIWTGEHGIPSGSNFTNIIGSKINQQVCSHPAELSEFLGDDLGLVTARPEKIFERYDNCGLTMNESKTMIKPSSFVYLQRYYHPDYVIDGIVHGIYPLWRALNRLCYPERFTDFNEFDLTGSGYFAIRSLSIMENCKYHPLFEIFVKFWLKYERYAVPSNRSITQYVKMWKSKNGSLGTTNQYGDNPSGIRNFRSFQLVVKYS